MNLSSARISRPRRNDLLPLMMGLVIGVLGAVFLLPAATALAAPPMLPPLSEAATGEHHVGKVVWAELITPDLAAAERFYGGLFGWTFRDTKAGVTDYALVLLDGRPIGGLVSQPIPAGQKRQPAWLTFLAARDVDAVQRAALAHGGKVLVRPYTYPSRGRQAILTDPQGAAFGVLASQTGDPPDYLAEPGEWIWSSVLAKNPDTDAAFYRALFGYDVFDLPSDDNLRHVILSNDDFARVGVNQLPADSARRHSHWLDFVRVNDATDAAQKATALGGRVLVEPRVDRHGGKLAVLADPAGAPFGVMEWSLGDTQEEPK